MFAFNRNTIDSKVNWNGSNKLNVFGRFSFLHYTDFTPTVFGTDLQGQPTGGSSNPGNGHGETYSATFGGNYTFTPAFVMDAYFGFTRQGTNSEQVGLGKNIGADVLGSPGRMGLASLKAVGPSFSLTEVLAILLSPAMIRTSCPITATIRNINMW